MVTSPSCQVLPGLNADEAIAGLTIFQPSSLLSGRQACCTSFFCKDISGSCCCWGKSESVLDHLGQNEFVFCAWGRVWVVFLLQCSPHLSLCALELNIPRGQYGTYLTLASESSRCLMIALQHFGVLSYRMGMEQ